MGNIQDHLDDIDWRSHEERRAGAKEELLGWYESLRRTLDGKTELKESEFNRDNLQGQIQMLGACLWLILPEKELRAFRKGYKFIDQDAFNAEEKQLFMSLQAFNGSPYCKKESVTSVLASYQVRKPNMRAQVRKHLELANKIAHNIVVKGARDGS